MRVRADAKSKIQAQAKAKEAGGMDSTTANKSAAKAVLGKEIQGFKDSFNKAVLDSFDRTQVTTREGVLRTQLRGRVGGRDLGTPPDAATIIADVQKLPDLQFGTESSAIYHPNKHPLPGEHQTTTYGPDEVSRYLRSANETIRTGAGAVERTQDGGFSIAFTKNYRGKTMRAIVRVNAKGNAVIATYGDAP
jgi:hypothetical protein